MSKTKSKSILEKIIKYLILGYTIAYEMRRYQSIYISGGGHRQVLELKNKRELKNWKDGIKQLKRSKYLTSKKIGNRLIINLTNKGQTSSLLLALKQAPPTSPGYSTLVIFDIPEEAKKARQALRLFLKKGEFKQLQKSVWLLDRDVVSILEKFITYYKINSWVKVFHAKVAK